MKIQAEDYEITSQLDSKTATIQFSGLLLLNGAEEYAPVTHLLSTFLDQDLPVIILDMQNLRLLNSSGFQMLSKFVLRARAKTDLKLVIQGNSQIPWQTRSLKNLQRLMPNLDLRFKVES
jgi:hypothetical protein